MADFLLEIGLEEIPARMIDSAEAELRRRFKELLVRESLGADAEVEPYSTPRRLAVLARGIAERQVDLEEQVTGPSVKVAYKDGQPTPAAYAFAKKMNVDVTDLQTVTTSKGEYIAATVTRKGRSAEEIFSDALPREINALYWAKNMYWRAGKPERFVRPVRWMVAVLGERIVPLEYGGIKAGRSSRGHRLLGGTVEVKEPASYAADLKQAGVFARRDERYALIRSALDHAVRGIPGARWREDRDLLNTVVNLTEFPSVILGSFDHEYLSLPEEVLVTVMRDHQKYFAVEDASGRLAPHFLAVLNTDSDPKGLIRHGNERVLRARFNDAQFFWKTDQKHPLRDRVEWLKNVTFQKDLGSYYDKTIRVQKLAHEISGDLNAAGVVVRSGVVHKAALLAKTDLTTELVKEFTELQGIVGGLYARAQKLDDNLPEATRYAIADAIYDQYKPQSIEYAVPRTIEGAVLSIADKADTIAGMFALGMVPSGSKDPFALRRQANGIVKTVAEHKLALSLDGIFTHAGAAYEGSSAEKKFTVTVEKSAESLRAFFRERLEFYLRDVLGFAYDVVNAVLAAGSDDIVAVVERARAVAAVRGSEDFESISVAFKRIKNILRQAEETNKAIAATWEGALFTEPAESQLGEAVANVAPKVRSLAQDHNFEAALAEIAAIRPQVDRFFDKVMVMVEDPKVRGNRLALLRDLLHDFSGMADFSEIVTEKK